MCLTDCVFDCMCSASDIRPENIMIDEEGHIKLIDFGYAREAASDEVTMKTGKLCYVTLRCVMGDVELFVELCVCMFVCFVFVFEFID